MGKQPTFKNQHANIVEKLQTLGYEQCSMQSYETPIKLYKYAFNMYWQMTIIKILVKIHMSTHLHCTRCDSKLPLSKDTIQLLNKLINVHHLLYTCKYHATNRQFVYGILTILYGTNITFGRHQTISFLL
jgi:hypothetical protein